VGEILQGWNIGPESVVFVDDNPMELEEVQIAFPAMTCRRFPLRKHAQALKLFEELRDLFGKPEVQPEDALRTSSIRANALRNEAIEQSPGADFVRQLKGKLTIDARKDRSNKRLLELINKTNQFNLNGTRISEGDWQRHLDDASGFAVGVSYEDRFGPLGVIAVMAGRQEGEVAEVTSWVLSCRAFSRKIEQHMLDYLFQARGVTAVRLAFQPTERNGPMQEFLQSFGLDCHSNGELDLSKRQVLSVQNALPHEVRRLEND
jgi:FkbH-like protein